MGDIFFEKKLYFQFSQNMAFKKALVETLFSGSMGFRDPA